LVGRSVSKLKSWLWRRRFEIREWLVLDGFTMEISIDWFAMHYGT